MLCSALSSSSSCAPRQMRTPSAQAAIGTSGHLSHAADVISSPDAMEGSSAPSSPSPPSATRAMGNANALGPSASRPSLFLTMQSYCYDGQAYMPAAFNTSDDGGGGGDVQAVCAAAVPSDLCSTTVKPGSWTLYGSGVRTIALRLLVRLALCHTELLPPLHEAGLIATVAGQLLYPTTDIVVFQLALDFLNASHRLWLRRYFMHAAPLAHALVATLRRGLPEAVGNRDDNRFPQRTTFQLGMNAVVGSDPTTASHRCSAPLAQDASLQGPTPGRRCLSSATRHELTSPTTHCPGEYLKEDNVELVVTFHAGGPSRTEEGAPPQDFYPSTDGLLLAAMRCMERTYRDCDAEAVRLLLRTSLVPVTVNMLRGNRGTRASASQVTLRFLSHILRACSQEQLDAVLASDDLLAALVSCLTFKMESLGAQEIVKHALRTLCSIPRHFLTHGSWGGDGKVGTPRFMAAFRDYGVFALTLTWLSGTQESVTPDAASLRPPMSSSSTATVSSRSDSRKGSSPATAMTPIQREAAELLYALSSQGLTQASQHMEVLPQAHRYRGTQKEDDEETALEDARSCNQFFAANMKTIVDFVQRYTEHRQSFPCGNEQREVRALTLVLQSLGHIFESELWDRHTGSFAMCMQNMHQSKVLPVLAVLATNDTLAISTELPRIALKLLFGVLAHRQLSERERVRFLSGGDRCVLSILADIFPTTLHKLHPGTYCRSEGVVVPPSLTGVGAVGSIPWSRKCEMKRHVTRMLRELLGFLRNEQTSSADQQQPPPQRDDPTNSEGSHNRRHIGHVSNSPLPSNVLSSPDSDPLTAASLQLVTRASTVSDDNGEDQRDNPERWVHLHTRQSPPYTSLSSLVLQTCAEVILESNLCEYVVHDLSIHGSVDHTASTLRMLKEELLFVQELLASPVLQDPIFHQQRFLELRVGLVIMAVVNKGVRGVTDTPPRILSVPASSTAHRIRCDGVTEPKTPVMARPSSARQLSSSDRPLRRTSPTEQPNPQVLVPMLTHSRCSLPGAVVPPAPKSAEAAATSNLAAAPELFEAAVCTLQHWIHKSWLPVQPTPNQVSGGSTHPYRTRRSVRRGGNRMSVVSLEDGSLDRSREADTRRSDTHTDPSGVALAETHYTDGTAVQEISSDNAAPLRVAAPPLVSALPSSIHSPILEDYTNYTHRDILLRLSMKVLERYLSASTREELPCAPSSGMHRQREPLQVMGNGRGDGLCHSPHAALRAAAALLKEVKKASQSG